MSPSPSPRMKKRIGLGRMDAALDAMEALGFSRDVVRRKVNKLLKVYQGPEGFVFIEEGSYKLLIEMILEEQENPAEEGEFGTDEGQSSSVSPAREVASNVEPSNDVERVKKEEKSLDDSLPETPGKKEERSLDNSLPDTHPSATHMDESLSIECTNHDFANSLIQSHLKALSAQQAEDSQVKKKRRRCHGWISSDEEYEVVCLVPTLCGARVSRKKRKSRWDVRPEDV